MESKRRKTRLLERMNPCICCRYPLSHRHHLLEVAEFSENGAFVFLCANCHDLYHLIRNWMDNRSPHCIKLIDHLVSWACGDDPFEYQRRYEFLHRMVVFARSLEVAWSGLRPGSGPRSVVVRDGRFSFVISFSDPSGVVDL